MKTHEVIIKILQLLEDSLDKDDLDISLFKEEVLGIKKIRRDYILEMMQDVGLIKGVLFSKDGNKRSPAVTFIRDMKITLKGIMYLEENTATAKIIKAAKLIKDIVPMI
ncbi:hypothetical protein SDC9_173724 [bioreactor metagenome]|uniref:YjcQ protein n=1 Tax=bioreactor metagenome TaxID=1076179 RepID=A0A645GJH7_9ZZZZ